MNNDISRNELKALVKRANKIKNPSPEEIAGLTFGILNNTAFIELKNEMFTVSEEEDNFPLPAIDIKEEVIQSHVKSLPLLVKQRKFKGEVQAIKLECDSLEYPFPAWVFVIVDNVEEGLDFELVKPKELHYERDAVSADFNEMYSGNTDCIDDAYSQICVRLMEFDWKKVCNTSSNFTIVYVKAYSTE